MFVALEKIVSDVRFELESKNFRRRGHLGYQMTTLAKVIEFLRNMFITAVTPRVYPFGHPGAKEFCVF